MRKGRGCMFYVRCLVRSVVFVLWLMCVSFYSLPDNHLTTICLCMSPSIIGGRTNAENCHGTYRTLGEVSESCLSLVTETSSCISLKKIIQRGIL